MNLKNEITGKTKDHLIWSEEDKTYVHREVFTQLKALKNFGRSKGIDLRILSGYRSFETQKNIVEKKIKGTLPILNDYGEVKDPKSLTPSTLLDSILRWSALPGFSRHHWGTDFDIYDKKTLPLNYQIQLVPEEYQKNGPFQKLSEWIESLSSSQKELGLSLPYKKDLGGVAKEPWHISFSALAPQYEETLTYDFFINFIHTNDIPLKKVILERSQEIYNRFIKAYFGCSTI